MVEHNLAKVGVASSNLVSRSTEYGGVAKGLRQRSAKPLFIGSSPIAASTSFNLAGVAKLVDARDLKSLGLEQVRAGSIPALGTMAKMFR